MPNAFGFAWADGAPDSRLRIAFSDENSETIAVILLDETFGDPFDGGQTAEDRFVGVISNVGVQSMSISSLYVGDFVPFEIDHFQYGIVVPEPNSFVLLLIGLCLVIVCRNPPDERLAFSR